MLMRRLISILVISALGVCSCLGQSPTPSPAPPGPAKVTAPPPVEGPVALPNKKGSLKFFVIGDFGTAGRGEYDLAAQVAKTYEGYKVDLVITVGDNLYGAE